MGLHSGQFWREQAPTHHPAASAQGSGGTSQGGGFLVTPGRQDLRSGLPMLSPPEAAQRHCLRITWTGVWPLHGKSAPGHL